MEGWGTTRQAPNPVPAPTHAAGEEGEGGATSPPGACSVRTPPLRGLAESGALEERWAAMQWPMASKSLMKESVRAAQPSEASTLPASCVAMEAPGGHHDGMLLLSFLRPPSRQGPHTARTARAGAGTAALVSRAASSRKRESTGPRLRNSEGRYVAR